MNLILMNKPQCLLYSAAMILDTSPEELIDEIGHDGMAVWWSNEKGSRIYRGHHIQEIQECCYLRNLALVPWQTEPLLGHDEASALSIGSWRVRIHKMLKGCRALICYIDHVVAWDGEQIFDPAGGSRNDLIEEVWFLKKIVDTH